MRKPRDYDAELATLSSKAKLLKERKVHQLGELVIATGADALSVEQLAGALLAAVATKDAATSEEWRVAGAGFFRRTARGAARREPLDANSAPASEGSSAAARS